MHAGLLSSDPFFLFDHAAHGPSRPPGPHATLNSGCAVVLTNGEELGHKDCRDVQRFSCALRRAVGMVVIVVLVGVGTGRICIVIVIVVLGTMPVVVSGVVIVVKADS